MKRPTLFPFLAVIVFTLQFSCQQEEDSPTTTECDTEYFYYTTPDSKYYLTQSLSEIWIVFNQEEVSRELAESILSKYSFIDMDGIADDDNQVMVKINHYVNDCAVVNDYLKVLNEDDEIFSATSVFYGTEDPDAYFILLSEVLTKNHADLISESDFIDFAETMNLELVEAKHSTQRFKVKDTKTGFEALEISNQIFESGKVQYSHPNSIIEIIFPG